MIEIKVHPSRMSMKKHVFLSYCSENRHTAQRLYNRLTQAGEPVWWDQNILPGHDRPHETRTAMDTAYAMICCVSQETASRHSSGIYPELRDALELQRELAPGGIFLIVVRFSPCNIPEMSIDGNRQLKDLEYLDLFESSDWHAEIERLVRALNEASGRPHGTAGGDESPMGSCHNMPVLPQFYLERTEEVSRLRELALSATSTSGISGHGIGLPGMGGIGKTVMAAAVGYDPEVRRAFPDGIVWMTLGQMPDLADLQSHIALCLNADDAGFGNIGKGKTRLKKLFDDRRALLILDDVWHRKHLDAFPRLSGKARLLVTSRDRAIIDTCCDRGKVLDLTQLSKEQAEQLLRRASDTPLNRSLPKEAEALACECGYLPLALAMIGAMVGTEPKLWQLALKRLRNAELKQFKADFEAFGQQHANLFKAIHVSIIDLPEHLRECFVDQAVIPEDFAIAEDAYQVLWHDRDLKGDHVLEVLQLFERRSLILRDDRNRVVLHDLVHDYIVSRAGDLAPRHRRLVNNYRECCGGNWTQPSVPDYFQWQLFHHLHQAGETNLVREVAWRFVHTSGIDVGHYKAMLILKEEPKEVARVLIQHSSSYRVLCRCLGLLGKEARGDAFRLLKDAETHSSVLCRCLELLGKEARNDAFRLLKDAETHSSVLCRCLELLGKEARNDAFRLLEESKDKEVLCRCLELLGEDAREEAFRLLEESKDKEVLCRCLELLGEDAREEAFRLLEESKDKEVLCRCLELLGEDAREEAFLLLEESKDKEVLCRCLDLLGQDAREEAFRLLEESKDKEVLCRCLDLLGQDAREEAFRLLEESKDKEVLCRCLELLGKEARGDAFRLLKDAETQSSVLCRCLELLGEEAREEAFRLLDESEDHQVLCRCLDLLGQDAYNYALNFINRWRETHHHVLSMSLRICKAGPIDRKVAESILDAWPTDKPCLLRFVALSVPYELPQKKRRAIQLLKDWKHHEPILVAAALAVFCDERHAMKSICQQILSQWKIELQDERESRLHLIQALAHPLLREPGRQTARDMLTAEAAQPGLLGDRLLQTVQSIQNDQWPSWTTLFSSGFVVE